MDWLRPSRHVTLLPCCEVNAAGWICCANILQRSNIAFATNKTPAPQSWFNRSAKLNSKKETSPMGVTCTLHRYVITYQYNITLRHNVSIRHYIDRLKTKCSKYSVLNHLKLIRYTKVQLYLIFSTNPL